jgi:transcriptional regulator with XRE-family HTH domain
MRYDALRAQLRAARRQKGLSQEALAARSGASRVTIARFETGTSHDVRVETLARLCEALELELGVRPQGVGQGPERQLAREQERARRLDRRRRHAVLAVRLVGMRPAAAATLVERARRVVDRWEKKGLCSRHYISGWRTRLEGSIARVARSLVSDGERTDALLQNSPWTFALPPAAEAPRP